MASSMSSASLSSTSLKRSVKSKLWPSASSRGTSEKKAPGLTGSISAAEAVVAAGVVAVAAGVAVVAAGVVAVATGVVNVGLGVAVEPVPQLAAKSRTATQRTMGTKNEPVAFFIIKLPPKINHVPTTKLTTFWR